MERHEMMTKLDRKARLRSVELQLPPTFVADEPAIIRLRLYNGHAVPGLRLMRPLYAFGAPKGQIRREDHPRKRLRARNTQSVGCNRRGANRHAGSLMLVKKYPRAALQLLIMKVGDVKTFAMKELRFGNGT